MRITLTLIAALMPLFLAGCGSNESPQQSSTTTNNPTAVTPSATATVTSTSETQQSPPAESGATEGTVHGTIEEKDGKLMLTGTPDKMNYTLTDAEKAKQYVGKTVMVSGHVDHSSMMIHVHKIEPM